ncbi:MAG: IS256 family transposase [Anaerolineae bacterium CG1_02_58_13]|nr:MAG: IS256 family transposase [Anaerolineae bacterium CG1_02_58_13]
MTHDAQNSAMDTAMQMIGEQGFDGLVPAMTLLFNTAMEAERASALGAGPWERTEERRGYANGFKPKTLQTRIGALPLKVPQVRGDVEFYPQSLERGLRSEKALRLSIAEMYFQGVTTDRVRRVMEKMCGTQVSSATVSRMVGEMDGELEKWRSRPLGHCPMVILDARYEHVRVDGAVRCCAVLVATGVREDGKRSILGVSVSLSEAEVHWREFLLSLRDRGLCGVTMVTSDDHPGLKGGLKTAFPGAAWQRCQTHLQRNAQGYVPTVAMRPEVAQSIRDIFDAPDLKAAEELLARTATHFEPKASKLAAWMRENLPEGFSVFSLPRHQRKRLRTNNMNENLNKQIKRRTRLAGVFPNEASLLRVVTAVLVEISDEWESGNVYLNMTAEGGAA